jgi:hypothetical protein
MHAVTYRSTTGVRPALVVRTGYKFISLIWMDSAGIRIHRLPKDELRYMSASRIAVTKFKRALRSAGRAFGITKGAAAALRG